MPAIDRAILSLAAIAAMASAALPAAAAPTTPDWSKAVALQTIGGVVNPAVLIGFNPQPEPPAYTGDTLFEIVDGAARFTITEVSNPAGGAPQNFQFLFGAASPLGPTAITFPPDPINDFRIGFVIGAGDAAPAFNAVVDVTSTSGGAPAPGSEVSFNPQPEPPALGLGDVNWLTVDFAVTSLSDVTLTVRIFDASGELLELVPVAAPEPETFVLLGLGLLGLGLTRRRQRSA